MRRNLKSTKRMRTCGIYMYTIFYKLKKLKKKKKVSKEKKNKKKKNYVIMQFFFVDIYLFLFIDVIQ